MPPCNLVLKTSSWLVHHYLGPKLLKHRVGTLLRKAAHGRAPIGTWPSYRSFKTKKSLETTQTHLHCHSQTIPPMGHRIQPVHYNSQCITFPEWISLYTLCLAPLIAHIASGTPSVTYLTKDRPKWYDHLCHYNPTSIIWRYAAIADRRIRARSWDVHDLAASNAIFWTSQGWDGGEAMVSVSAAYCLRYPEVAHVELFTTSALKTIITTLQGVSALHTLLGSLVGIRSTTYAKFIGLDMIYFPLAILGLLRLCAALWLTDDFEYHRFPRAASQGFSLRKTFTPQGYKSVNNTENEIELLDTNIGMDPFLTTAPVLSGGFKTPGSSWPSRIFRFCYLLIFGGVWVVSFMNIMPVFKAKPDPSEQEGTTTTAFFLTLFYLFFLTVSMATYSYYFVLGRTNTTVLPCIASTWYKVYTHLVMIFMVIIIVIASIETNKGYNGLYTSGAPSVALDCADLTSWWTVLPNSAVSGLASDQKHMSSAAGNNYSGIPVGQLPGNGADFEESYWLYNFTGYCKGRMED